MLPQFTYYLAMDSNATFADVSVCMYIVLSAAIIDLSGHNQEIML